MSAESGSRKKRVLHLGWAFSPHVSRWAKSQIKRGYETLTISYGEESTFDFPVRNIKPRGFGKVGYLLALGEAKKIAQEFKPDLTHAHYAAGFGLWGLSIKSKLKTPLVVSALGTDVTVTAQKPLSGALVRWVLEDASQVIAPSEYLELALNDTGVTYRRKPQLVTFGIDLNSSKSAQSQARRNPNKVQLLFLKAHRHIYGADTLLRAFALLRTKLDFVTLTIAGKGELSEQLMQLAQELGVTEHTLFPGYISSDHVLGFIAGHDLMVMPTRVPESFGVAALEAASVGVPTVASNIGGIPEIVLHQQTGLLVPPDNPEALATALYTLCVDRELRHQFGANARKLVEDKYDWNRSLEKLDRIYSELLAN